MEHEDVLRAWTYWEKMGVIRKIRRESADKFDYDVEFVLLKEQFYGDKESKRPVGLDQSMQAAMGDKEIQEMFQAIEKASGSVLSGTEMLEIVSWINDFNATPEVIAYGYAYCVKRKKTNIKYIAAVINGWTQRGFRDVAAVEKYLSEADKKNHMYKRIFQGRLGSSRNVVDGSRSGKKIMDTWFEEMEFSLDKVLEACSKTTGIANPNINYVNKVLVNWYEERTGKDKSGKRKELTLTEISQYYETLRHKEEKKPRHIAEKYMRKCRGSSRSMTSWLQEAVSFLALSSPIRSIKGKSRNGSKRPRAPSIQKKRSSLQTMDLSWIIWISTTNVRCVKIRECLKQEKNVNALEK